MMNQKACTTIDQYTLHNYTKLAHGFFEGYRTPAAILAVASMMALFQMHRIHRMDGKGSVNKTRWEKLFISQCHLSFFLSFLLSVMVLLVSSTSPIRMLRHDHGQYEHPITTSAYDFLMEEFSFESLAVRWSFIVSIISCLRGVVLHIVLDQNLLKDDVGKREQFAMVFSTGLSIVTCIFSYVNANLYSWDNFMSMTWDLLRMVWNEALGEKPLKMLSLFSAGISVGLSIKVAVGNNDDDMKKKSKCLGKKDENDKILTTVVEHHEKLGKVKAEKHH